MIAKGRSWYTLILGGTAFRSLSRGAMLSLSEDNRILLKCFSGEGQSGNAASHVVFQQTSLVGFKQKSLHAFPRQKEQLPTSKLDQLTSSRLVLFPIVHADT